ALAEPVIDVGGIGQDGSAVRISELVSRHYRRSSGTGGGGHIDDRANRLGGREDEHLVLAGLLDKGGQRSELHGGAGQSGAGDRHRGSAVAAGWADASDDGGRNAEHDSGQPG